MRDKAGKPSLFCMNKLLKIKLKNKTEYHNSDDKRHRDNDLPAIIYSNGDQEWYRDGKLHRDNGPAIIWPDGYKAWWVNDNPIRTGYVNKD